MGLLSKDKDNITETPIVNKKKQTDKSIEDYVLDLSSKDPVPGGGGTAAVAGALGAALGGMVASLTIGKEKYKESEAIMTSLKARAYTIQKELLELAEADAEVFSKLAPCYKMPEGTDEEKENKSRLMEAALKDAADVPLKIMRKACEAIVLMDGFAKRGSSLAISDAGCGALLCKAALQSAWLNVCINTKAMKDREYAGKIDAEGLELLSQNLSIADSVYGYVEGQLIAKHKSVDISQYK